MKFTVVISGADRHPSDVAKFILRTLQGAYLQGSVEVHDDDCNYDENGVALPESEDETVAS